MSDAISRSTTKHYLIMIIYLVLFLIRIFYNIILTIHNHSMLSGRITTAGIIQSNLTNPTLVRIRKLLIDVRSDRDYSGLYRCRIWQVPLYRDK